MFNVMRVYLQLSLKVSVLALQNSMLLEKKAEEEDSAPKRLSSALEEIKELQTKLDVERERARAREAALEVEVQELQICNPSLLEENKSLCSVWDNVFGCLFYLHVDSQDWRTKWLA